MCLLLKVGQLAQLGGVELRGDAGSKTGWTSSPGRRCVSPLPPFFVSFSKIPSSSSSLSLLLSPLPPPPSPHSSLTRSTACQTADHNHSYIPTSRFTSQSSFGPFTKYPLPFSDLKAAASSRKSFKELTAFILVGRQYTGCCRKPSTLPIHFA